MTDDKPKDKPLRSEKPCPMSATGKHNFLSYGPADSDQKRCFRCGVMEGE